MAIKSYFFFIITIIIIIIIILHRKIIRYDVSDHLGFSCHMKARLFTLNLTLERKKMPNNFFTYAEKNTWRKF